VKVRNCEPLWSTSASEWFGEADRFTTWAHLLHIHVLLRAVPRTGGNELSQLAQCRANQRRSSSNA